MRDRRAGFTLVELMIVISILLLLTLFVVSVFNANASADRMRSASRVVQSAVLGARDRALHAKERRGVRLISDATDPSLVTGSVYTQPMGNQVYELNSIQLERYDGDGDGIPDGPDIIIVRGFVSPDPAPYVNWFDIGGFFANPGRIRIPASTGPWYTFFVNTSGPYALTATQQVLQLTAPFPDAGAPTLVAHTRTSTFSSCEIELAPELLPNHQPIPMSSGVVVDLFWSQIPASWYQQVSQGSAAPVPAGWVVEGPDPANAANVIIRRYALNMDVMFSPRGMVTGPISALGPIHLLLADIQDATQGLNPIDPANKGEKLILTIFPQTGNVQTFPIDPTDIDANGFPDDLFRYAKVGSTAGQ